MIVADFNRKDINWNTGSSSSEDDCKFIEASRDSFLTRHVLTPTRGRGTNDRSLLDLFFTSNGENIESIEMHAPLGKPDHSMIYRSQPENLPEKIVCNYAKADFEKMKEKLDDN